MFKYLSILIAILQISTSYSQSYFQDEAIFPLQDKHVHSSSIIETESGDLLVCWFHGSGERWADDVVVQGSRLKNGVKKWEPVFLMADTPGFPDCNPVLHMDADGKLWLFWLVVQAHRWEQGILKYRISEEYDKSGAPVWSWQDIINLKPGEAFAKAVEEGFKKNAEEALWAEYAPSYADLIIDAAKDPAKRQIGWMPRIHPFVLESGRILLPLYSDGFCLSLVAISDDKGQTWRASLPMVGMGLNQPSIVQKKDGTLLAYMRDEGPSPGSILLSRSKDDGETWTYAEKTNLPNPSSSMEVLKLMNGEWAMVYNDIGEGRYSLAVVLSDDEGATWKWKKHLALDPQKKLSFSYPSMIQSKDGLIHVTYSHHDGEQKTIKHAVFNIDWVKDLKR
jgi:predicted neuraminidase